MTLTSACLFGAAEASAAVPVSLARASTVSVAPTDPGGKATGIKYTSATVVIPTSVVKRHLLKVSPDGSTYTFNSFAGPLGHLAKGKVMLLEGYAVRDVTATKKSGKHLVVSSTAAALSDVLKNGTVSWDKPISFVHAYALGGSAVAPESSRRPGLSGRSAVRTRGTLALPARFGLTSLRHSAVTLKGKTSSYDYKVTYTPGPKSVGIDISIEKSSPIDMSVTIQGTLDNLKTAGEIAMKSSRLKSAKVTDTGLKGKFTMSYSFKPISQFGLGSAGGIKITLPAEIEVPFAVGEIPLFLGIKTAFFASVGFSGFDQSVTGSYSIDYNGSGGFTTSSSGANNPLGVLKGIGKIALDAADAVNKGPLSVIFGAQMPQIELGLGVKGINVGGFVTLIGDAGVATYGSGCDTRGLQVQGSAGAEAKFFGFSAPLGSATLFTKSVSAAYPKGCGKFPGFG